MNILEILPSYDKVEIYPEYRTYTKENPRSGNEYDYEYDLYIIYFEKFVILRDYGCTSFQEKPVVIPRVFFDKVHPLEDRLAKAKRFLEFGINNSYSYEQDLVKSGNWNIENINNNQNSEQLRKFLNLALDQDDHQSKSYSNDKRESISTLMEMLTTLNKFFTVFPCSEPKQKIIDLGRYFQDIKELKNEEIVLTPKEFEEVYQDFLNRIMINHSDDGNEKDYEYSNDDDDDDDDAEFGYLAGLVADGELNPNDPRWPF